MDLAAVKAKLTKLNNKTSKQNNLWKPEEGKQTIRILPYKYQPEMPFMELFFHYGIAKRTILSPTTKGEPDPIADFAEKLRKTGDKEDWELSKDLTPKMRIYAPVLVRGKEKEGVKFWGFGKLVYQELLGLAEDPDYANFEDPTQGRDFTVDFTKGVTNRENKTVIRPKPGTSPISEDKEIIKMVSDQPNLLEDVWQIPTFDELTTVLEKHLNPEAEEDAQLAAMDGGIAAKPTAVTPTPKAEEVTPNTTKVDKVEDVASAFDNLFDS